ncbi:MAG TPA: helix-turn-helix transcriptional regulator [Thermomicrobiales bacterium]|nr:helix-turn-helix transcriptional regulator [Thermomicrobiales bacterium]
MAFGGRIGPVLARWREELGWTQEELAQRAGISRGYLSRLERDIPEQPGLAVLSRVCGTMGHSWAELYRDAGLSLPGDVTLADIAEGINDPELMLYLRRLPELDARDREVLRALLRFLFERHADEQEARRPAGQQLALPVVAIEDGDG